MQAGAGLWMDVWVSVCPGDADGFSHPRPLARCIPEEQAVSSKQGSVL